MGFDNRGVSEIDALIIEGLQTEFNRNLRILPKSFVRILSKVLAGVFVLLEKSMGWLYLQLFPDTADFGEATVLGRKIRPLVKLGEQWGVGSPRMGSAWRGRVLLAVLSRGVLPAGVQLKSEATGRLYVVEESVSLDGAEAVAAVRCAEVGSAGNLADGAELSFVSPVVHVARTAGVAGTDSAGTDDETEAEYRNRVMCGYSARTQGGSLSDYRAWAADADGVLRVYPYPSEDKPAHVLLYVAGKSSLYPDRIPDRALCVAVGRACTFDPVTGAANRKPVTDVLDPGNDGAFSNVMPVRVAAVSVGIMGAEGSVSAFAAAFRASAEAYLLGREPYIKGLSDDANRSGTILRNVLCGLAAEAGLSEGATFGGISMEVDGSSAESYELGRGELARLSALSVDGEEY